MGKVILSMVLGNGSVIGGRGFPNCCDRFMMYAFISDCGGIVGFADEGEI